ncbi:hypothetical protein [Sphingomonas arenae]|uniref:hypothetical protein n=1 Tax=Sphingomonas arenae TaxID=2812555 RepID=UPI0019676A5A|nr:hypothetical protein [Sphingomonas arenae]
MITAILYAVALAQPVPARPVPLQAPINWRSAPLNGGIWLYRAIPGGSEAVFQTNLGPQFTIRCTLNVRRISFMRAGAAPGMLLRIMTTSSERTLPVGNTVASFDPVLDAIAFSRGRVAVLGAPAPILIMPSWAEPARAIEDCRK